MSLSEFSLIGCCISITSKAKIRYEGYLHSVDFDSPNEPVITLSKVWSFGTEDRPCERVVAPRNEEYNQVVFRGRDLEDVHLVKSSVFLNEDSAIVSAAPGTSVSQQSKQQAEDPSRDLQPKDLLATSTESPNIPFGQPISLNSFNPLITPPLNSNAQTSQPPIPLQDNKQHGPRPFGDGRSEGDGVTANSMRRPDVNRLVSSQDGGENTFNYSFAQRSTNMTSDWGNERLYDRGISRMGNNYRGNQQFYGNYSSNSNDNWGNRRHPMKNKWHNNRPNRIPQGGYRRRGSRSNGVTPWPKPRGFAQFSGTDKTAFSEDYDYEKANAELAAFLEEIHISAKSTSSTDENTKDDESTVSPTGDDDPCYDKTRSFFDTLSSEMMDKANGVSQHGMNRRDERVLNTATFGASGPPQFYRRPGRSGGGGMGVGYGYRRGGGGGGGGHGNLGYWRSGPRNVNNNSMSTGYSNKAAAAPVELASFPPIVSTLSPSHAAT